MLKYIIACGGRRSASTFQYQVAKHIVEKEGTGKGLGFIQHMHLPDPEDDITLVVKSHAWLPQAFPYLENREAVGIHIHRDIRDVIASTMRLYNLSFDEVVPEIRGAVREKHQWMMAPKGSVLSVNYTAHYKSPVDHVAKISGFIGYPIERPEAVEIASLFAPHRQKERMPDPAHPHNIDPDSQLHGNHITNGRPGSWQDTLTSEQGAEILDLANQEWNLMLAEEMEEDAEE